MKLRPDQHGIDRSVPEHHHCDCGSERIDNRVGRTGVASQKKRLQGLYGQADRKFEY